MTTSEIACHEAEAALLGCLLRLSRQDAAGLLAGLEDEDFTDPRHRLILAGIRHCLDAGVDPDPVTVLGTLRQLGLEPSFLANKSAGTFLADIYGAAPVPLSVRYYRATVVEHRARRRVVESAERWQQIAGTSSLADLRSTMTADMQDVVRRLERAA